MATIPTIHLNGSSGESLRNDMRVALRAVHAAIDAVCEAAPNARDYYVQGDEAWRAASAEHAERLNKLHAVYGELNEIYQGIYDQVEERKRKP